MSLGLSLSRIATPQDGSKSLVVLELQACRPRTHRGPSVSEEMSAYKGV